MKKIKVQSQLSIVFVILLSIALIAVFAVLGYFAFTMEGTAKYRWAEALPLLLLFIPLWLANAKNKSKYVSEIQLTENDLTLVYIKEKKKSYKTIPLNTITKFDVLLDANNVGTTRSASLFCKTTVTIEAGKEKIEFEETPTADLSFCSYSFILRLLKEAWAIPNFNYRVKGNAEVAKADVDNFARTGKRLGAFVKNKIAFKTAAPSVKKVYIFSFLMFLLGFGLMAFSVYMLMPGPKLNPVEAEYMAHYDAGYELRRDGLTDKALREFNAAEEIYNKDQELYIQKAYCYERKKEYEKAIAEARKALEFKESDSLYKKARGYRFNLDNDISIYTIIGDSSRKLKDYKTAIDAYTYIIDNVKYTYTNAYFQRGRCLYYSGDKIGALSDFIKHKEIIEKYLKDQAESDHQAKYPTYTYKDLEGTVSWIKRCKQ